MKMHQIFRRIRFFLGSEKNTAGNIFFRQTEATKSAFWLFRIFLAINIGFSIFSLRYIPHYLGVQEFAPLPVTFWFQYFNYEFLVFFVFFFYAGSSIYCSIFPQYKHAKILFFLSLLWFLAFRFSGGKVNHDFSTMLWFFAFAIFLPSGTLKEIQSSRIKKQRFLTVYWWMQLLCLSFHWQAGLAKFLEDMVYNPLFTSKLSIFHSETLGNILSSYLLRQGLDDRALWADFFIRSTWLSIPMFLGVVYLQFLCFYVCFRPKTYRIWAILILLFHVLNNLLIAIPFNLMGFFVAILLLCSPFRQEGNDLRVELRHMPVISFFYSLLNRESKAT